jgi:preprotein translocase SecE subunit
MGTLIQYFIDVKNELAKVVWPSTASTIKYTAIVVVFSAVIGAILGAADYGLIILVQKIVTR